MNMFTNKIPFSLLSEEDKNLFRDINCRDLKMLHKGKFIEIPNQDGKILNTDDYTLRLIPKVGEYYHIDGGVIKIKKIEKDVIYSENNGSFLIPNILDSRPATEEEIEEYKEKYKKPKEPNFIDCEIDWNDGTFTFKKIGFTINTLGYIKDGYIFARFICADGYISATPILCVDDETTEKATHARWYKL